MKCTLDRKICILKQKGDLSYTPNADLAYSKNHSAAHWCRVRLVGRRVLLLPLCWSYFLSHILLLLLLWRFREIWLVCKIIIIIFLLGWLCWALQCFGCLSKGPVREAFCSTAGIHWWMEGNLKLRLKTLSRLQSCGAMVRSVLIHGLSGVSQASATNAKCGSVGQLWGSFASFVGMRAYPLCGCGTTSHTESSQAILES